MRRKLFTVTSLVSLAVLAAFLLPLPGQAQPFSGGGFTNPRSGTAVVPVLYHVTATGAGYTLTDGNDPIDFAGIDPNVTLGAAGTYLVTWRVEYNWWTATMAANENLTTSLQRRNNTPATLGTHWHYPPPRTTPISATLGDFTIVLPYVTTTVGDVLGLNTQLSAVPTAGTLKVEAANIVAVWEHP